MVPETAFKLSNLRKSKRKAVLYQLDYVSMLIAN